MKAARLERCGQSTNLGPSHRIESFNRAFNLFNNAALVKVGIADTNRINVERLP